MGPAPIPIPGLSVLLGMYSLLFPAPAVAAASEREDRPTIHAVIPALNEAENVPYAVVSIARQTVPPDALTVVSDGSTDATAAVVEEVGELVDMDIEVVKHAESGGKTRRIKQTVRASSAEKLFVLDADTYLEDDTYLERLIAAHEVGDIGCSFGIVRPDSRRLRREFHEREVEPLLPEGGTTADVLSGWLRGSTWRDRARYRLLEWPVEQYRDVLYSVEQSFSNAAHMRLFGTALFPVGCGVLYDRAMLRSVFDDYEASLGDQLTNSEDIFIGFVFVNRGHANVQVDGVTMRTTEPSVGRLGKQAYLWGSSFLQSAYYFRSFSDRLRARTGDVTDGIEIPADGDDHANVDARREPLTAEETANGADGYETDGGVPASGDDTPSTPNATEKAGRRLPVGSIVAAQLVDGFYPVTLFAVGALALVGVLQPELLLALILVEFALYFLIVGLFTTRRLSIAALLLSIPVRLVLLPLSAYVYGRVGADLVRGNRDWTK